MTRAHGSVALRWAIMLAVTSAFACAPKDPATPQEARTRGDALLKEMSDTLAAAKAFSFDTAEVHERVRRNGEKVTFTINQQFVVQRPSRFWAHATGADERDFVVSYDGKQLAIVGNKMKIYATLDMPDTIDGALDRLDQRFDFPIPVADFLYSSPYESFADPKATGGWVRRESIDGRSCDVASYQLEPLDFTVWVSTDAPNVPCQVELVYKAKAGKPTSRITFRNWNLAAAVNDAQFAASMPSGYEKIPVVERIPKAEMKADPKRAMSSQ